MMEQLEERWMMWAAPPGTSQPSPGTSLLQQQQAHQAAVYQQAVNHSIEVGKEHHILPSVLGTWTGKVKVSVLVVSQKFNLTVAITNVKPTKATGTITVEGHKYSGTFTGVTKNTEEFSYSYTKGKASVTIAGLLNGLNTAATGTVTAKYDGWKVGGTFSFTKVT
jgi:hypothetical protein